VGLLIWGMWTSIRSRESGMRLTDRRNEVEVEGERVWSLRRKQGRP
jgi:hypothetical protein